MPNHNPTNSSASLPSSRSNDGTVDKPFALRLRALIAMTFICVLLGAAAFIFRAQNTAMRAARSSAAQGPLNQVVMALHNYHEH
jgi:hypothetical protein